MHARPYFQLLNATGKVMTCLRHNQTSFEIPHPEQKYSKMQILGSKNEPTWFTLFKVLGLLQH